MKELGSMLREERESKALSLAEIHSLSRIGTLYLEAIEEGDFSQIPGEVYLRGFLRRYAECVGLQPDMVIEKYLSLKREAERESQQHEARTRRTPTPEGSSTGPRKAVITIVVLALVLAAAYAMVRLFITNSADERTEEPKVAQSVAQEPDEQEQLPPEADDETEPEVPPVAESERVQVRISLLEDCWFEIIVDDKLVLRETRHPGETLEYAASNSVKIKFGNPQGTRVLWNGKEVRFDEIAPTTRFFTADAVTTVLPVRPATPPAKPVPSASTAGTGVPPVNDQPAPAGQSPAGNPASPQSP